MDWFTRLHLILILFISSINSSASQSSISPSPSPSPSPSLQLCHFEESSALLQFKNSFSIDNRHDFSDYCDASPTVSWKNGTDCCTAWDGITCNSFTGHVIGLNVSCGMLRGNIDSNSSLFLLRDLRSLVFSHNDFRGSTISPEFGNFEHLTHLEISFSNFSGKLPDEISYLSKLSIIDISDTGALRMETSTLKRLVTNLTNIQEFTFDQVDLSSIEPVFFMNLSSSFTTLILRDSGLSGNFPANIFELPNLQKVELNFNENLTSSLLHSNWSASLKFLDLSWTEFQVDFHTLTKISQSLETLLLSHCKIIGWNPALLANLTQVSSLDLSANYLGGHIPWLSMNLKIIKNIALAVNHFIGQLPEMHPSNSTQIFISSDGSSKNQSSAPVPLKLEVLDLSFNFLNGTIPLWLYSLPSLKVLFLYYNHFSGYINEFHYPSLKVLVLAENQLQGPIPKSIFQQEYLTWMDLSSNNLSGVVEVYEFSKLKHLEDLRLSFNRLSLSSKLFLNNTFPDRLYWLSLSSCNISEFPNFLKTLENMFFLDLSKNQIEGSVPNWMWNVGKDSLHFLNLSHNFLTNIEQLPWNSLEYLDLRSNLLQGRLPIPPPSLLLFSISNNLLTGEIPPLICNSFSLQVLDLSNNRLNAEIPPCIGNFSSNLSVLNIGMNKLHGMIPFTFSKGNSLRNLNLNGNQLEGLLPPSLLNCSKLEIFDVGNNRISDTFPYWLESFPVLQVLVLRSNRFHGSIGSPKTAFPFQKLRIMDISNNEFSGNLPEKYFENLMAMINISYADMLRYMGEAYYKDSVVVSLKGLLIDMQAIQTIFTAIDFSNNAFEGEIPWLIGKLKSLKGLNFSHNRLNGSIPSSLGNLSNLEWLDLSSNELAGKIPQQLTDLTSLSMINLSENRLAGLIPHGKQFDTFDNSSYLGILGLCGVPLSKTCSISRVLQQNPN